MHTVTLPPAIEAKGLFKVFGRNPKDAVRRLRAGASRADVADAGSAAVIDASFTVQPGEIFVDHGTVRLRQVHACCACSTDCSRPLPAT